ncbi:thymidylate synthase [Gordonia phage Lauer]|uniref:Thymidylate synthase n=1 Tax=Gordonia phage Lauer TaxID=2656538 RepID=A0A649VKC6_9CAUD|nr:thymidylate synthase [Gordonia phage Lauer]QGJ92153.1 thymidylate synthase [Gordonia phage Lauer]
MITTWAHRRNNLAERLLVRPPVDRSSWQSGAAPSPVYELDDVVLCGRVNPSPTEWQTSTGADIPWAETHFQERVSGRPLNPAPSYVDWPWHSEKYREQFKARRVMDGPVCCTDDCCGPGSYCCARANPHSHDKDGNWVPEAVVARPFDHTYPERMWPKFFASSDRGNVPAIRRGIRFDYGDLQDVVNLLVKDPFTRQAYLPIWFPEDTGSTGGQRVPCTLGYHFIRKGAHLDMKYFIRSCDITRHFHNDVYMAGRLLHWVVAALQDEQDTFGVPYVGNLTMFISNLHMFTADAWRYNTDGSPKQ